VAWWWCTRSKSRGLSHVRAGRCIDQRLSTALNRPGGLVRVLAVETFDELHQGRLGHQPASTHFDAA
jgi:hypothetical protein